MKITITPFILGSGRSANAIKKSLLLLGVQSPEWVISNPVQLVRGQRLEDVSAFENPLLIIANANGMHAQAVLDGVRAGYGAILVEKPACVNLTEVRLLKEILVSTPTPTPTSAPSPTLPSIPIAVCHVYRQMWGIQTLKRMLDDGELGDLICIEGRYWQSSVAQRALELGISENGLKKNVWKNDLKLSGGSDALLDVGVHWVDAVSFLMGETEFGGTAWQSYVNAEAPHRDTHVHLNLKYSKNRRAIGSISKTVHGATNHFEINVLGSKKSARWEFLNPDEILLGKGNSRQTLVRQSQEIQLGSQQPPFHATGWLEGYVETIRQLVLEMANKEGGNNFGNYPRLSENLKMLGSIFSLERSV